MPNYLERVVLSGTRTAASAEPVPPPPLFPHLLPPRLPVGEGLGAWTEPDAVPLSSVGHSIPTLPASPSRPAVLSADHPGTVGPPVSLPDKPQLTAEGKQLRETAGPEPIRDRLVASEPPAHTVERPASPEESAPTSGASPQPAPMIRAPRALRPFPPQALPLPLSAALRTLSGGDMGAPPPGPAELLPATPSSEARPATSVPQPPRSDIPSVPPSEPARPGIHKRAAQEIPRTPNIGTRPADASVKRSDRVVDRRPPEPHSPREDNAALGAAQEISRSPNAGTRQTDGGVKRNDRVVDRQPPEPHSPREDGAASREPQEFTRTPNVGTRQREAAVTVPHGPASPGRRETRLTIGRIDVQVNNRPTPPASAPRTRAPGSMSQNVLEARCLNRFQMKP